MILHHIPFQSREIHFYKPKSLSLSNVKDSHPVLIYQAWSPEMDPGLNQAGLEGPQNN